MSLNNKYTYSNCTIGNNIGYEDCYGMYLGKVVSITVDYRTVPIKGKLIKLSVGNVFVERLDGNITVIARRSITSMRAGKPANRILPVVHDA
jgi:hypothetical protein